jgi:3-hydroxyacyl-[acyl-carrier-protein] dehydratase
MRWFWIDRFTEFESGRRATAIKNVSLAEEHLHDHFPGAPLMPSSLIIEGLAQTGGLLIAEHSHFEERVVLAKVSKAVFNFYPVPGDTLVYQTVLEKIDEDGANITGTSHVGDRLQAEVEIFFAHLDESAAGKSLFEPGHLLSILKILGVFTVGRSADGKRLEIPHALAAADQG